MLYYSLNKDVILRPPPQWMDSVARHVRRYSVVHHPSTGQNLLMTGVDLLNGGTDTDFGITTVRIRGRNNG